MKDLITRMQSSIVQPGTFNRYSDNARTHEGGLAPLISDLEMLRRSTLSFLLWEGQFYESGEEIADRISNLVGKVAPEDVYNLALEARNVMKLRHVPLLLAVEMLKHSEHKKLVRKLVSQVIQRPDEICETLAIYWRGNIVPFRNIEGKFMSQRFAQGYKIPMQLKRGCRDAFAKFDQYQILKWLEKGKAVSMADAVSLLHPNPNDCTRKSPNIDVPMTDVYKSVVERTANAPDTWESRLSIAGKEAKKDIFTDMLSRNQLGSLALISNLRGMLSVDIDIQLIRQALQKMNVERVLPYRFIAAERHAHLLRDDLQAAMFRCIANIPKLTGKTILLVDISGSMSHSMSYRRDGRASDLRRVDAASGLCVLAQNICEQASIYLFDSGTYKVTKRNISQVGPNQIHSYRYAILPFHPEQVYGSDLVGFTLADAISERISGGTDLEQAISYINNNEEYDRIIVFTDDESATTPPSPTGLGYAINVASGERGVTYGNWIHINGFSEGTLAYISEYEKQLNGREH